MKLNKKALFSVIFLVGIIAAIFIFSSQNGSDSSDVSSTVSRLFCKLLFSGFDEMTAEQQLLIVSGLNHFIRKAAHFTAYALLGAGSYAFFRFSGIRLGGAFFPALIFCAAYAVLDEIHQYFTPGRSFMISDMLLDTFGAAFGAVFAAAAAIIIEHIKTKIIARKKAKPRNNQ